MATPGGRPENLDKGGGNKYRLPVDIRQGKREVQIKFDRAILEHIDRPLEELQALIDLPQTRVLVKMALRVLVKAAQTGNTKFLELALYSSVRKIHKKSGKSTPAGTTPPDLPDPE